MTRLFTLWAQSLDNSSPDHFEVRGEELAVEDSIRRQAAVSSVSSVIKTGMRVYDRGGVVLTADAHHFVLEVRSAERDRAGRAAPIVCHGEYQSGHVDALAASAALSIDDFARRIGRTLEPEHVQLARDCFGALKKKTTRILVMRIGMGALVFIVLATAFWLAQRGR